MSEPQVDFSMIRGDWHFHMNYVSHAVDQTLARAAKLWAALGGRSTEPALDAEFARLSSAWAAVSADRDDKGSVKPESPAVNDFIAACRAAREPGDAWLDRSADASNIEAVKEFAESCRQLRGLCDDLELMREQKPFRT
jgi:hypothetical protein